VSLPRSAGDAVSSSTPMSEHPPALVTAVLQRLQAGDVAAADELMPMVYTELRAIAGRLLREGARPATRCSRPRSCTKRG
jgi:hypothetical protein